MQIEYEATFPNINKDEINLCQKMYKKKVGCAWGRCEDCAVIPLLVKLHEGKIVEDKEEISNLKDRFLKQV